MAVKAHPFMPQNWQNPTFLLWLRRTHGWIGLAGAAFGILFSLTTLFMEHDGFGLEGPTKRTELTLVVPASAATSLDAFGAFTKQELNTKTKYGLSRNADVEEMEASGNYSIVYKRPGQDVAVRYIRGNAEANVTITDRSMVATLNKMHRAESVTMTWKIMADAFSGALLFLAITGIMMWAKNHGSRWFAVGLFTVGTGLVFYQATVGA